MAYVRTRLGRLFYEERGKARRPDDPVFVLGHSYLCDGGMWRGQVTALAELGRVVNLDGPGHGKSDVPPPFSLDDHTAAMTDVFTELGIGEAIMIGLSWGGMVAMRMALASPQRVAGLILMDTSSRKDSRHNRLKYRALLPIVEHIGLPRALVDREVVTKMFGPKTLRERPDLVAAFARTLNGFDRRGIVRAGRAVMTDRTDISSRISDIRTPTLVLCGRDDIATKPEESDLIARRIPGARLAFIEDAGHLSAVEQPEVATRHIVDFIRTIA